MTVLVCRTNSFMVSADRSADLIDRQHPRPGHNRRLSTTGETHLKSLEDDHGKFEQYALPDRKPMKVAQYQCYLVKLPGTGHSMCRRILDCLKLI